jgi:hypothetical protein
MVGGELMDEDDRRASARFLVIELHSVGIGEWHFGLPGVRLMAMIAGRGAEAR